MWKKAGTTIGTVNEVTGTAVFWCPESSFALLPSPLSLLFPFIRCLSVSLFPPFSCWFCSVAFLDKISLYSLNWLQNSQFSGFSFLGDETINHCLFLMRCEYSDPSSIITEEFGGL